ncbi:MAG: anti-sigma factor family protein [bacterium]
MRCEQVREKLDAYAADELTAGVREQVADHLAACEGCRQALARQRHLAALLRGVPAPPVPDGFRARLMVAARERLSARERPVTAPASPWRWWRSASVPMRLAAAAVLVLGLSLGALMGLDAARSASPGPSAGVQVAQADPTAVYNLDALADAPGGSLAEAYLTLASARKPD